MTETKASDYDDELSWQYLKSKHGDLVIIEFLGVTMAINRKTAENFARDVLEQNTYPSLTRETP